LEFRKEKDMDNGSKRTHYFHAYADAFGGRLYQPFEQVLTSVAPTSLPVVGGYGSARQEDFRVGELISIDKAYTQVAGSTTASGSFLTLVTSVLEGVNIDNIFFADRIALQMSTDHPASGYFPKVSFVGTHFRGVRVGSCELEPELNLGICDQGDPRKYPSASCLFDEGLRAYAREQSHKLAASLDGLRDTAGFFERFHELHSNGGPNTNEKIAERGNIACSVVVGISAKGRFPGTIVGNVIEIPAFGRIHLGELLVEHGSFDLTMIRLEMGCPTTGHGSGGHGGINGSTVP